MSLAPVVCFQDCCTMREASKEGRKEARDIPQATHRTKGDPSVAAVLHLNDCLFAPDGGFWAAINAAGGVDMVSEWGIF